MTLPQNLSQFVDILIDSYFIIDLEHNLLDYNSAFVSMLPRAVARKLKTMKCYDVLQLSICKENCIARQCWKNNRQVRLDEIMGTIIDEEQEMRFILSAIPIRNEEGVVIGAIEMQRNVTDEALVQAKYQRQMEASALRQRELEKALHQRTRRLLEISRRLYIAQKELLKVRTELFG